MFIFITNFNCKKSRILTVQPIFCHSYRNASTGFLVAALRLCQLTVTSAIKTADKPASAKIHQLTSRKRNYFLYEFLIIFNCFDRSNPADKLRGHQEHKDNSRHCSCIKQQYVRQFKINRHCFYVI